MSPFFSDTHVPKQKPGPPVEPHPRDGELVCYCYNICRGRLRQAIADGARTVHDIRMATGACTGCAGCRPDVEEMLEEHKKLGQG